MLLSNRKKTRFKLETFIVREGTKKHAAKDVFIVTISDNAKVAMQKIIHPQSEAKSTRPTNQG